MNTEKLTTYLRYRGEINGPIISELLDDLDFKCINMDAPDLKRKKIFNIAVEMFQNLYHYTRDLKIKNLEDAEAREVELAFESDAEHYILSTSNFIKPQDEEALVEKIEKVNKMDQKELRSYYREILTNETFSNKGGAGLGFVDMKKRSDNNLEFLIESINKESKKYTLIVKVKK